MELNTSTKINVFFILFSDYFENKIILFCSINILSLKYVNINIYFKIQKQNNLYIYSGAKKYLVSHQLCKFSHLKR